MSYKQLKPFNQKKAGDRAGWCLQNVRLGFGIASKYANAITAWNNNQQHKNRSVPTGIDVPLFYSYKTDGHINVRLANGKVWSDGNIYASLDDYLSKHPAVHYLGWGESVDGVRVLQAVAAPKKTPIVIKTGTWNVRTAPDGKVTGQYVTGRQKFSVSTFRNGWACIGINRWIGPAAYKKA
jgi:hypothetical protein